MAKSKNATTHHLGQKVHRNGIYKIKDERYSSLKGVLYHYVYSTSAIKDMQETEGELSSMTHQFKRTRALKRELKHKDKKLRSDHKVNISYNTTLQIQIQIIFSYLFDE